MADDDFVRRVKDANNIVDVIGDHVGLKRRGNRHWGLSPFKHEKTPSFSVQESNQLWYCFATGQGGDVIQFVQAHLNLDFRNAIEYLAKRAGIPVPSRAFSGGGGSAADALKGQLLDVHEKVAHWWHGLLLRDPAAETARAYLAKRGISEDTARAFRIGYAPDTWDATLTWARSEGFNDKIMVEAGLAVAPEDRPGRLYDRFRGRLMFPICTEAGSVVAFSGRVLDPEAKEAKYVNSPETRLFSKGRLLFGLDKNKRDLITAGQAILCEGQIDLITCHQAGVRTLLAPQGTAFTPHQARVLKRIVDEVVICFDSDEAGRKAVLRAGPLLLAEGLAVRVLILPDGNNGTKHDPDSFVRAHGADAFRALASEAPEFWPHVILAFAGQHDPATDRGRAGFKRDLFEVLSTVDPLHYDTALLLAAGRLQTTHLLLREELKRALPRQRATDRTPPPDPGAVTPLRVDGKVDAVIRFCLQHPAHIPEVHRTLHPEWVTGLDGHDLLLRLLDATSHDDWPGVEEWTNATDPSTRSYLMSARLRPVSPLAPEMTLADCLATLELSWLDTQLAAVRSSLAGSADTGATLQALMSLQQRQQQVRRVLDRTPGA